MAKKLEISRFYHILAVFGHFGQFKHEKSTQTKFFPKIWLETLKMNMTTPGGNSPYCHPRGSNA